VEDEKAGLFGLALTCPPPDAAPRKEIATALTDAVVALFTPARGPGPEQTPRPHHRPPDPNVRFHSYPPTDFAVGGRLLSARLPRVARLAKRLLG
jgi:hypothetical protein